MRYPISSQDVMKGDLVYKTRESKKTFKYDGYCRLEKKYFASDYDDWNGNLSLTWLYLLFKEKFKLILDQLYQPQRIVSIRMFFISHHIQLEIFF